MSVVFPQTGGCLCGALRYRLLDDPLIAYVCHCTDCQTATGSAFALCLTTPLAAIEFSKGEPARRTIPFPDGRTWNFAACPECETRLWSERKGTPEILSLKAGTLDDVQWVRPVAHIWTSSALEPDAIPDDALVYPHQPGDPTEMVRAWRGRAERNPSPR